MWVGSIMKWLIKRLQKRGDNQPSLSSLPGRGESRSDRGGIGGSHRGFMELWRVIMAVNKLYKSVKCKVDVKDYSQTLYT